MTAAGVARPSVAAVLAGGQGRRLRRPKAEATLAGEALIARPLAACAEAGLTPVVIAKPDTPLPRLNVTVWREPRRPSHPLCGIVEALRRASGPVLVCGCDMPFLTSNLVAWVASQDAPLAITLAGGRIHPLLGLYAPSLLPSLEEALAERWPLTETVQRLGAKLIDEEELGRFGDPARLLFNVNDECDLETAERLLATG